MSLLPTIGAIDQDTGFYNGAVSTSLRFDRASAHYLSRDQGSAGNQKVFTLSFWVKRGILSVADTALFGVQTDGNNRVYMRWEADDTFKVYFAIGGTGYDSGTTMKFRDTSAWYHVAVVVNMSGSGDTGKLKIYVNGVNQTVTYGSTLPDSNTAMNSGAVETLGKKDAASNYMDGYLADVYLIDGTAVGETSGYLDEFGEVKEGVWIPKKYTGSYGTNGFHLEFTSSAHDAPASEGSADTDNIGADSSGQNHHWTAVDSISADDCAMPDSPENNFSTMNPLSPFQVYNSNNVAYANGNLNLVHSGQSYAFTASNFAVKTGKWYAEMRFNTNSSGEVTMVGISEANMEKYFTGDGNDPHLTAGTIWYISDGAGYYDGSSVAHGAFSGSVSWGAHDTTSPGFVIGVALDLDSSTRTVTFTKDGGNSFSKDLTSNFTDHIVFANNNYSGTGGGNKNFTWNFGQDSTFGGLETATSNSDANGNGTFHTAPPSGYLALCSANLEEPTIGPNSDTKSSEHFAPLIYSASSGSAGAGSSTPQDIDGLDFKPDLVWIKGRSYTDHHALFDSSRGVGKYLLPNVTNAEATQADTLDEFRSDGFGLGADSTALVNYQNNTYVAWNWKANGGTTTTNDASSTSIGDRDSVFQANTISGFSIVTYTGSGQTGAGNDDTYRHGLQVNGVATTPEVIICKNLDATDAWLFGATAIPSFDWANDYMHLNDTLAHQTNANRSAFSVAPTSTVFSVGEFLNKTNDYVAYLFASVEGYSKFGTYAANADADGPFIYTGFRPALVVVKKIGTAHGWEVTDSARNPFNEMDKHLLWNTTAGDTTADPYDFYSNGFKLRTSGYTRNRVAGAVLLYMAFAEAPFKYANAR